MKIIVFGFVIHKRSYLRRSAWNVFDFIIVTIGLVQLIPEVPNLKSVRTLRILRPLRTINAVPSMKRLVTTLLMSLPQIGYLISILLFFITIFGILGIQLFSRHLYQRCRFTDEPALQNITEEVQTEDNEITYTEHQQQWTWEYDPSQERLCGGIYQCLPGTYCHGLIEKGLPLSLDKIWEWDFINYGILNFDNIGVAVLAIFRVITLEGWSGFMYNYLDSTGVQATIFFPLLVIVGNFFLLKLFLAVIMQTFSEMSAVHIQQERINQSNETGQYAGSTVNQTMISEQREDKAIARMMEVAEKKVKLSHGGPKTLVEAALMMKKQNKEALKRELNNTVQMLEGSILGSQKPDQNSIALGNDFKQDSGRRHLQPPSSFFPISVASSIDASSNKGQGLLVEGEQSNLRAQGTLMDIVKPNPMAATFGAIQVCGDKENNLSPTKDPFQNKSQNQQTSATLQSPQKATLPINNACGDAEMEEGVLSSARNFFVNAHTSTIKTPIIGGTNEEKHLNRSNTSSKINFSTLSLVKAKGMFDKLRRFLHNVCNSQWFTTTINVSIILNTVCLSLDKYPQDEQLSKILDALNFAFSSIFFIEMVVKVGGMGPKKYIRDYYNIFDACIVIISIVDVFVSVSMSNGGDTSSRGPISALRAFRLMRIFKLSKSWKKLRNLLTTIYQTLQDISSFSVLLFLLIFIYVLLGMELFAQRDIHDFEVAPDGTLFEYPRYNFNNFFSGFIVIFTVLSGESWDQTMFAFAHSFYGQGKSYVAIIFFVSFVVIGVMIFLNLFLAILLENFQIEDDDEEVDTENNQFEGRTSIVKQGKIIIKNALAAIKQKLGVQPNFSQQVHNSNAPSVANISARGSNQQLSSGVSPSGTPSKSSMKQKKQPRFRFRNGIIEKIQPQKTQVVFGPLSCQSNSLLTPNIRNRIGAQSENFQDGIASEFGREQPQTEMNNNGPILTTEAEANGEKNTLLSKRHMGQLHIETEFEGMKIQGSSGFGQKVEVSGRGLLTQGHSPIEHYNSNAKAFQSKIYPLQGKNPFNNIRTPSPESVLGLDATNVLQNKKQATNNFEFQKLPNSLGQVYGSSGNTPIFNFRNSDPDFTGANDQQRFFPGSDQNLAVNSQTPLTNFNGGQESAPGPSSEIRVSEGFLSATPSPQASKGKQYKSIVLMMKEKKLESEMQKINQPEKNDNTKISKKRVLFLFKDENILRIYVTKLVQYKHFDTLILLLILIQSVFLALDNPLNDPNSTLVTFLEYSDIAFTAFFALEAACKIISLGLIFHGPDSYLLNGWNVIDITVVILSILSLSIGSGKLKIFKIFRLLKVLRPLRVISRNKGLKIGIQALFMALPNIMNVIIISSLFFIIFGIIGVNYFKGSFYSCNYDSIDIFDPNILESILVTKYDCLNIGGTWANAEQHFDNLPQGMSTLFQMATTEGWIDVMNSGVDSTDIDYQPIKNNNIYWSLFFMFFILFGNFLILNLFAGVVVATFNKEKELLGKNFLLTENQKKWLENKKLVMQIQPKLLMDSLSNPIRENIRRLVMSRPFDIFILVCIILNTLILAINWYDQSEQVDSILGYINYCFAFLFLIEAVLKLIGFGPKAYFHDKGNIFDFIIVLSSIVSSIASIYLQSSFGSATTFIRAFRISRILKYVQRAKHVKIIFETLIITIPALTNIGGLLLLFLYMFSVLGVFLFADIKLQTNIDIHANFQSFIKAFMTLIRCSTGEAWGSLMTDAMRPRSILFQCTEGDFNYDVYLTSGMETQGCGSGSGIIFFISYMVMVPYIFLNLFIAIILQGFEQTSQKVSNVVSEEDLENFRNCWAEFDRNATGFIRLTDMAALMLMLGEPLGWNEELYKNDQNLQDDFLEELNITTYNGFKDVLFWDVLQALTKVYMIRLNLKQQKVILKQTKMLEEEDKNGELGVIDEDEVEDEDSIHSEADLHQKMKEAKNQLRLELEFEQIDDEKQDVFEVEEMKIAEEKLMKGYKIKQDEGFTSAHIKAGRKILNALYRMRNRKIARERKSQLELVNKQAEEEKSTFQFKQVEAQSPVIKVKRVSVTRYEESNRDSEQVVQTEEHWKTTTNPLNTQGTLSQTDSIQLQSPIHLQSSVPRVSAVPGISLSVAQAHSIIQDNMQQTQTTSAIPVASARTSSLFKPQTQRQLQVPETYPENTTLADQQPQSSPPVQSVARRQRTKRARKEPKKKSKMIIQEKQLTAQQKMLIQQLKAIKAQQKLQSQLLIHQSQQLKQQAEVLAKVHEQTKLAVTNIQIPPPEIIQIKEASPQAIKKDGLRSNNPIPSSIDSSSLAAPLRPSDIYLKNMSSTQSLQAHTISSEPTAQFLFLNTQSAHDDNESRATAGFGGDGLGAINDILNEYDKILGERKNSDIEETRKSFHKSPDLPITKTSLMFGPQTSAISRNNNLKNRHFHTEDVGVAAAEDYLVKRQDTDELIRDIYKFDL